MERTSAVARSWRAILALLDRVSETPWFSYAALALVQLKVILALPGHRDLTAGDTAAYFTMATSWLRKGVGSFVWSPLYALFYACFLLIVDDAIFATVAHRVVLIAAVSLGVLILMRRLFPPSIAWLLAAWWAVLPTNFDAAYEVHLFGLLPLLVALSILDGQGEQRRGLGLAALFLGTLLVRNELAVVAGFVGVCWLWGGRKGTRADVRVRRRAVVAPVAAVIVVTLIVASRATDRREIGSTLDARHRVGFCQLFSYYAAEQNPLDAQDLDWVNCGAKTKAVFGVAQPTLWEAWRGNPRALLGFFWWNVKLVPGAIEMLCFGVTSGGASPDFGPVPQAAWVVGGDLVLLIVLAGGGLRLAGDSARWVQRWRSTGWAWLGLMAVVAMSGVVAVAIRPRPDYLLPAEIAVHAAVGVAVWALVGERTHWLGRAFPMVALGMIALWPVYEGWSPPEPVLARSYLRLKPFAKTLESPGSRLLTRGYAPELCDYLSRRTDSCTGLAFESVQREAGPDASMEDILESSRASVFYADESLLGSPRVMQAVSTPPAGWRVVAFEGGSTAYWAVLKKEEGAPLATVAAPDIAAPGTNLKVGQGWYDYENFGGETFRWAGGSVDLTFADLGGRAIELVLEPGPGSAHFPLVVEVAVDGATRRRYVVETRKTLVLDFMPPAGRHGLTLRPVGEGRPLPTDHRLLRFRVFRVRLVPPPG